MRVRRQRTCLHAGVGLRCLDSPGPVASVFSTEACCRHSTSLEWETWEASLRPTARDCQFLGPQASAMTPPVRCLTHLLEPGGLRRDLRACCFTRPWNSAFSCGGMQEEVWGACAGFSGPWAALGMVSVWRDLQLPRALPCFTGQSTP